MRAFVMEGFGHASKARPGELPKPECGPDDLLVRIAAAAAYQALFLPDMAAARAGQSILIHGASGGLGSFAVAFAHATGLRVAATCRAVNADYVRVGRGSRDRLHAGRCRRRDQALDARRY